MMLWFGIVVFAYYYKAVLCGFFGHLLGMDFLCLTFIRGISTNHWIEIIVYCPLLWLALHQVNADVFGDVPSGEPLLRRHRALQLVGEFAIALVIYGTGVHIANVIEILSREREQYGDVYELVYFLDEGVSHYIQFVPLFFVIGWFIINDRRGRTEGATLAVFFGAAHGVERAIGIIEGAKWFLGPPTVVWLLLAMAIRWRQVGREATSEFFFRYAAAFCLILPVAQAAYYLRFDSFDQPSAQSDERLVQLAIGALLLTVAGTVALAWGDRWWRDRRAAA